MSEDVSTFVTSWHWFINSITVGLGLLHSKPLTNGHVHYLIIVESTTSNCGSSVSQNHFLRRCSSHVRLWCAGPTGAVIAMDVCSTIYELSSQLVTHCNLDTPSPKTSVNWRGS
jgi:hypothetical protein